jgi:hypothetical protein
MLEFAEAADRPVTVGRGRDSDVRVGHQRVQGRWIVSKAHAAIRWDGRRWTTTNVSDKPGLLHVYEPGYEEVPLEPGRSWAPDRHRWSYAFGSAAHRFDVVCETDEHRALSIVSERPARSPAGAADGDDEPTAGIDTVVALRFTELERATLRAYYGAFGDVPRPATLEPATHDAAALALGRSRDSLRKALARINDKISGVLGAPPAAAGRNVSPEIGRWLARLGILDP